MDTEDGRCGGAHDREIANNGRELVDNERELENKYWLHPFEIGVMKERIEHSRKQLRVCWLYHDIELGVTVGGNGDVEDHFTGSPMK